MHIRIFSLLILAPLLAGLLLWPAPAGAHKVKVFAYLEGGSLKGEGYFPGGGKAIACPVKLLDAGGNLLSQATTGNDGAFTLALPQTLSPGAVPLTVVMEAGEGHRAQYQVTARDLGLEAKPAAAQTAAAKPAASPPPGAAGLDAAQLEQAVAKALAAQLAPIKAQMARLAEKDQVSVRDVVGGLGWIMGLMGLLAWFKSRRS